MKISHVEFIGSYTTEEDCPKSHWHEFAFIGRSNVGKSSLINFLSQSNIAKTSSKPGKTKTINLFLINKNMFWADLPGYGFALSSKKERKQWEDMVFHYLLTRKNLSCVFLLIDSHLMPQASDLACVQWMGENQIPFFLLFTKHDKIKHHESKQVQAAWQSVLAKRWEILPERFLTSVKDSLGRKEILQRMHEIQSQDKKA